MKSIQQGAAELLARKRAERKWAIGGGIFAACMALVILYVLIFPAFTQEGPVCGYEAHVHTDSCYDPASYSEDGILLAGALPTCGLEAHSHTEGCYPSPDEDDTAGPAPASLEDDPAQDPTEDEDPVAEKTPLILSDPEYQNYVSGTLYYRLEDSAQWILVTEENSSSVPGNAELWLEVGINNLPIDYVVEAGNQVIYTLPSLLKNLTDQENTSDNCTIVLDAEAKQVTLSFSKDLLNKEDATLSGSFHVFAKFDLSTLEKESDPKLIVGDTIIDLDLGNDLVAKFGELDLEKTVEPQLISQADGTYASYTLTVTAGDDTMTDIKVVDTLPLATYQGAQVQLAQSYVILEDSPGTVSVTDPTGTTAGSLTWDIPSLNAHETATLTYLVKLDENYIGHKGGYTLMNNAAVYTKVDGADYLREETSSSLPLSGKATVTKKSSSYTPNANGLGGTLTYTIWVKAADDNPYALTDLVIKDYLVDSNLKPLTSAPSNALTLTDFHLYAGGTSGQNGADGLTEIATTATPEVNGDLSFTYSIDALDPGESMTLVYTVKVSEGFTLEGNDTVSLRNRVQLYDNDECSSSGLYESYTATQVDLTRYQWTEKATGVKQESGSTVAVSGDCYALSGGSWVNSTGDTSFTYPEGSYLYEVWVNRAGTFNVSQATISDTLSQGLTYTGYLRVDAVNGENTVTKTVWLGIDGLSSFSFSPDELGFPSDFSAYHLTYYTIPQGLDHNETISVNNTVHLTGTVIGNDTKVYPLGSNVSTSVSTAVSSSTSYQAAKYGWFYADAAEVGDANWSNGALYWYVEVSGTTLPSGLSLKDVPGSSTTLKSDSLVGVYQGELDATLKGISTLDSLTPVDASNYTVTKSTSALEVSFVRDIPLGDSGKVYVVIRTSPNSLPNKNSTATFSNELLTKTEGDYVSTGSDSLTVYGSKGISKAAQGSFTVEDGKVVGEYSRSNMIDASGLENGTYIEWLVDVNRLSTLSGEVTVIDTLPEGTELGYVRYYAKGSQSKAVSGTLSLSESDGWMSFTHAGRNGNSSTTYYYNSSLNQVQWKVTDLETSTIINAKTAEYQVVARVTDPDVLLGGEKKDFINTVSATSENPDNILGTDSSGTSVSKSTLKKSIDGSSGVYTFVITANPLGEDLVQGSTTIKLVDEMSATLKLDYSTIQVTNSNTGAVLTGWTAELDDDNHLTLTLPDDQPLTITYSATAVGIPGSSVTISNTAHWWGYAPSAESTVPDRQVVCSIVSSFDANTNPMVSITKTDARDLNTLLSGATFALKKVTGFNGTVAITSDVIQSGTTDENGTLLLGFQDGKYLLEFNTVYQLVEISAPEGYELDSTPKYFAIAKAVNGSYPNLIDHDGVDVTICYQFATYKVLVKNQVKQYALPEAGGVGTARLYPLGIALVFTAGAALAVKNGKRKK